MSHQIQQRVVADYLRDLEPALVGVPSEVATSIIDGIAEELSGLGAPEAAVRIAELGDPAFIAKEAIAGSALGEQSTTTAPAAPTDQRWYVVLASLLVAVGGYLIPVLGWIAGIAMVWMSAAWRPWEKWVGTLAPLGLGALVALGNLVVVALVPGGLALWHTAILAMLVSPFLVGIWLLWRGLRSGFSATQRAR